MTQPASNDASGPLVVFRRAGKSFITNDNRVLRALQDVDLEVDEGEFLAIVGPSGCGKSTMLNMLAGLLDVTYGEVILSGEPPGSGRLDIGYVFQQDSVLPWKRVSDNIAIGLKLRNWSPEDRERQVELLLAKMGLEGFGNAYPSELSGGMRKRVALATTLAYNPSILLMDEPFGALDAQTRVLLQDELLTLWQESRPTVLFVTHDIGEAIAMADRVIVMTARPAQIKTEYQIDLPRPRSAAEVRFDPRFDKYYRRIWEDLRPELDEQMRISGERAEHNET